MNARNKLRSMGGIMASSPELMQVAGYQEGGPVAVGQPLNYADWMKIQQGPNSRSTLEAMGYPVSPLGGTLYFDQIGAGLGLWDGDTPKPPKNMPTDPAYRALYEQAQAASPTRTVESVMFPSIDTYSVDLARKQLETAEEKFKSGDVSAQEVEAARAQVADAAASVPANVRAREEEEVMSQAVAPRQKPVKGNPEENFQRILQKVASATQKTLEENPAETLLATPDPNKTGDGGAGGAGGSAPVPSKKDLRSRYKENLALFKEVYGTNDEDVAKDRMMALAMIGLSIAAGQSPNALTNIAQGALSGLQGMSEMTREQRAAEREMRAAALQGALDQQAAEASAGARAGEMQYDRETRLMVEAMKNRGGADGGGYRDPRSPIDQFYEERKGVEEAINTMVGPHAEATKDMTPEQREAYKDQMALRAVSLAYPQADLGVLSQNVQADRAASAGKVDPTTVKWVEENRAADGSKDDAIRKALVERGIDPTLYGL